MDREKSTARKISAERSWPTLSSTEQPSRTSGDKAGQKKAQSSGRSSSRKTAEEGSGTGQRKTAVGKTGTSQRKPEGGKTGTGQKRAAGEKSGNRQVKKAQSQPEVMTIRSGMRRTAYTNSGQESRNQGNGSVSGGQHRVQSPGAAAGGQRRTQTRSAATGSRSHTSGRRPGEDELRRMQSRQTQNRKNSQARRRRSARRSRHLLYAGMAAVFALVLFLAAGRIGKGNPAEASDQSGMILAENKKADAGAAVEAANIPEGETSGGGAETSGVSAKSWANHLPDIGAIYGIYVNQVGWSHFFADNSYCMPPVNQFITAFRATVHNQPEDMTGTIAYRVNLSGSGWLDWTEDAGGRRFF